jgi:hypothetical protein
VRLEGLRELGKKIQRPNLESNLQPCGLQHSASTNYAAGSQVRTTFEEWLHLRILPQSRIVTQIPQTYTGLKPANFFIKN